MHSVYFTSNFFGLSLLCQVPSTSTYGNYYQIALCDISPTGNQLSLCTVKHVITASSCK